MFIVLRNFWEAALKKLYIVNIKNKYNKRDIFSNEKMCLIDENLNGPKTGMIFLMQNIIFLFLYWNETIIMSSSMHAKMSYLNVLQENTVFICGIYWQFLSRSYFYNNFLWCTWNFLLKLCVLAACECFFSWKRLFVIPASLKQAFLNDCMHHQHQRCTG